MYGWNDEVILFFYFSSWCNAWQFHATCKTANRAGISGAGGGVHWFTSNSWLTVSAPPCTTWGGRSVMETSSHYWSLGGMQDWNDMHASVWQMAVPLSDSSIQFHFDGAGVSLMWQSNGCWILLLILHPGPVFGMLIQWPLCLQLGQWRWLIRASFCGGLTALLAMVPDGLRCDRGTAKALLTHQA